MGTCYWCGEQTDPDTERQTGVGTECPACAWCPPAPHPDDAPATVAIPHPYTAEDIDRGFTVSKGDQGREQRRAVPIDVLRLVEARRLNAILALLVGRGGKEG